VYGLRVMVFSGRWYLVLRGFNYPNKIWVQSSLSLSLLTIYTNICYHCSYSRGRRLYITGAYHPCIRISCFCMPCQGRRVVSATRIAFSCSLSGKTCGLLIFSGGYLPFIGTCSCFRRQVLVPNAKRWETGSWEVAGYLSAHVCSWLWTYHSEGRVDVVYLLAWVLGVVSHSS